MNSKEVLHSIEDVATMAKGALENALSRGDVADIRVCMMVYREALDFRDRVYLHLPTLQQFMLNNDKKEAL